MSLDAIKATFQASIDTKTLLVNDIERLEALLEVHQGSFDHLPKKSH